MFSKSFIQDIILAVSCSNASLHAAKFAIMLAKQYKCRLRAVYVADTAALECLRKENILVEAESNDWEAELVNQGKRCLAFVEELARAKALKIKTELRRGEISEELIRAASEKNAQLLVICGQGNEKCSNCMIAQTRDNIIRKAKCSVLLVNDGNIDKIYRGKK